MCTVEKAALVSAMNLNEWRTPQLELAKELRLDVRLTPKTTVDQARAIQASEADDVELSECLDTIRERARTQAEECERERRERELETHAHESEWARRKLQIQLEAA